VKKESWFEFSCIDEKTKGDFIGALLDMAITVLDFFGIGIVK